MKKPTLPNTEEERVLWTVEVLQDGVRRTIQGGYRLKEDAEAEVAFLLQFPNYKGRVYIVRYTPEEE